MLVLFEKVAKLCDGFKPIGKVGVDKSTCGKRANVRSCCATGIPSSRTFPNPVPPCFFHFTSCELQTIKDYLLIKMTGRLHLCYSSICYWPQILQFPKINELMDLYSKYWGWRLPISGYCVWRFLQLSMVKTFVCGKLWNARAPLMTSVLMFQLVFFLSDVPFICGDVCPQVPVFSGRSRPLLCPSLHSFPLVRMKLYNWHTFPSPLPCGPTPCCVSRTFIGWTQIL